MRNPILTLLQHSYRLSTDQNFTGIVRPNAIAIRYPLRQVHLDFLTFKPHTAERVHYLFEDPMQAIAIAVTISGALVIAVSVPLLLLTTQSKAAQAKARERRLAEHRMNARLLKLNL